MKRVTGINPDFADFDEIETDAEDVVQEYESGAISFAELKSVIGHEAALAVQIRMHGEGEDDQGIESLFDDPESLE